MKAIPIPAALAQNDRDRRGLPIPFIVYRDTDGTPHFTVDDAAKLSLVLAQNLCGLCGKPLVPGEYWLISGPSASFSDDGLFTNPPAHLECARYSVQVCPYLAAPVYARLIEDKTLKPAAVHDMAAVHNDGIAQPRPPLMVLACTTGIDLIDPRDGSGKTYVAPHRPWKDVAFWHHGRPISQQEAVALAREAGLVPQNLKWWPA